MSQNEVKLTPETTLLTTGEVAKMIRVDRATVTRWCVTGMMPSIRTPGGHRRIALSEVNKMLKPR